MTQETNAMDETLTLEVGKLAPGTTLFVETEMYLYRLEVIDPKNCIVRIETGDRRATDHEHVIVERLQKGKPFAVRGIQSAYQGFSVTHVELSGTNEQGPWSYEVF